MKQTRRATEDANEEIVRTCRACQHIEVNFRDTLLVQQSNALRGSRKQCICNHSFIRHEPAYAQSIRMGPIPPIVIAPAASIACSPSHIISEGNSSHGLPSSPASMSSCMIWRRLSRTGSSISSLVIHVSLRYRYIWYKAKHSVMVLWPGRRYYQVVSRVRDEKRKIVPYLFLM